MNNLEFLFQLERFGIKLGLDNITRLLRELGNPHERIPSIHVAGTNGKGSVLAVLDSIFRAAGYRVGRYTSPHLISLNERFLLNAAPISDAELNYHLTCVRRVAETMVPLPTFFECVTAVVFHWLAEQRVDIALIEVGMGGRFDATNVVKPLVAVITNIGLEHTKYLGDTLEKIAFEKAGIIKPGVPVVVNEVNPGPLNVILQKAQDLTSPTSVLNRDYFYELQNGNMFKLFRYRGKSIETPFIRLGLAGSYQGENAAASLAVVELLKSHYSALSIDAIERGLQEARWPCRMEKVLDAPPVIIDVAHNAHGAKKLAEDLDRCILVLGVSSDKAADQIIATLSPKVEELILTQFSGSRALPVDDLAKAAGDRNFTIVRDLRDALGRGMEKASSEKPLVVTGSIFLAGEARKILMEEYGAEVLRF